MFKLLVLLGAASALFGWLGGASLRRALWPLACGAVAYAAFRWGFASAVRGRTAVALTLLVLPLIAAPYVARAWRRRRGPRAPEARR